MEDLYRGIYHDHCYHCMYTCPECKKKFRCKDMLAIHLEQHTDEEYWRNANPNEKIQCRDCGREYCGPKGIRQHRREGNCKPLEPCQKCGKNFRTLAESTYHVRHSVSCGVVRGEYECSVCHKKFLSVKLLRSHQKSPTSCEEVLQQQPEHLMCEVCGKVGFDKRKQFNQHMRSHQNVVCKKCGSTFTDSRYLGIHKLKTCMGDKACGICGEKGFPNRKELFKHMCEHDPESKLNRLKLDHKCAKCGCGFTRPDKLLNHQKHFCAHGVICGYCGQTDFWSKPEFRKHMHDNHDTGVTEPELQDLICRFCFRSFNTELAKDKHVLATHRGINNPKTANFGYFLCDRCNSVSTSIEQLQRHKNTKHGVLSRVTSLGTSAKVQCKICDQFVERRNMPAHRRKHTALFRCQHCGKLFRSGPLLSYHRKNKNCGGIIAHKVWSKI